MKFICAWLFRRRRKWRRASMPLFVVGVVFLLLMYSWLTLHPEKFGNTRKVPIQTELVKKMHQEIHYLKKNIKDIQYFGEYDENPSAESFFGVLTETLHSTFPNKPESTASTLNTTTQKKRKPDMTLFKSDFTFAKRNNTDSNKFLFILGHYEQLGKTVINFMQAGLLAHHLNQNLVVPFVRNSRFCGLVSGWIGNPRRKTREFLPIDNYFQLNSFQRIFRQNKFSKLVRFEDFHQQCFRSTIVYFIYAGSKSELRRYFKLSDKEYVQLEKKLRASSGISDCLNIEERVQSGKRIDVKFVKAICVDPEIITSIDQLKAIVGNLNCVTLFLWRGIGYQRTHYNLTLSNPYDHYLSQVSLSNGVLKDAAQFVTDSMHNKPFIGIQIRSERQLSWYSLEKFKHCLDIVVKVASIFIYRKKIKHVFISSDLEKHGSDQMSILLNQTVLNEAKGYMSSSFAKLSSVHYYLPDKRRGLVHNDAGFVALTQMEILSRSRHLITLGAGTFQSWVKANFKKNKSRHHHKRKEKAWSITRVCSVEMKNNKDQKKSKSQSIRPLADSQKMPG
eukprot:TCONS_00027030-protein